MKNHFNKNKKNKSKTKSKPKNIKNKLILPNKIIPIPNLDKDFQEKWDTKRNLLNFPHSYRCVISARPNTGKSTIAKNIILRADPMFQKVYVIHIDEESKDYDDVDGIEIITEIPDVNNAIFDNRQKTLLILDDLEYKFMNKKQLKNLDRLFGYVSSHKSVSCIVISQDCYNIPACVRRMSNLWILGKINNDISSFLTIAKRCGMKKDDFEYIFDKYIKGDHDTFWIDRTKDTPYQYRINGFTVLDENNNFNIKK